MTGGRQQSVGAFDPLAIVVTMVLLVVFLIAIATATPLSPPPTPPPSDRGSFDLAAQCPPSFELREDGCRLVTRYQFYDSVEERGVGGTQTGLPPHREAFLPEQIDLGRLLFFDPLLSVDNSVSCASCHQPNQGFSDGQAQSVGVADEPTSRSAPSLWNVTFLDKFFWDARADSLEQQAQGPLFNPNEMGNTPEQLLEDLESNPHYPGLFDLAFPEAGPIDLEQITTALAAFQSSLISLNSRYDRYAHGHHDSLTEREIAGLNVFRSFVARCAECHQPPLFTNNQIAVIGVPEPDGEPFDPGAQETFGAEELRGGFKVPTLRNINRTAPYMHRGNFKSLREAVTFYNDGRGHAVPDSESLQLHWHIWEPDLTEDEIDSIVVFLGTLTDESLMPPIPEAVPSGLDPRAGFNPPEPFGYMQEN